MIWVWRSITVVAALFTLLGGFWFAQGAGLVTVDPILCAGDCRPVQAPSVQWIMTGAITAAVGSVLVIVGARRSRRPTQCRIGVTDPVA